MFGSKVINRLERHRKTWLKTQIHLICMYQRFKCFVFASICQAEIICFSNGFLSSNLCRQEWNSSRIPKVEGYILAEDIFPFSKDSKG